MCIRDSLKPGIYLILQKGSRSSVFVLQMLNQSKSFIPYGSNTEYAERDGGEKYGKQENNDQFFLPFEGNF